MRMIRMLIWSQIGKQRQLFTLSGFLFCNDLFNRHLNHPDQRRYSYRIRAYLHLDNIVR